MAEDAEAKALRLAAAEGLALVRSNNKTGFSNVHQYRGSRNYHVEVTSKSSGARENLGTFATAAEAALAYARYLGPERSHALAEKPRAKPPARIKDDHEFGQPRIPLRRIRHRHIHPPPSGEKSDSAMVQAAIARKPARGGRLL